MYPRNYKRISVNLEAEFVSDHTSFPAFVKNISGNGIHAKIAHTKPSVNFAAKTNMDIKLQLSGGETIKLNCLKKWSQKNTHSSFIENIGVEIIDPPAEYMRFYQAVSL